VSGYVKAHEFELKFDGDTVTVRARPLTQGDLLHMRALVTGATADEEAMLKGMADVVKRYADSVAGLYDAAGTPVTVDEVVSAAYFTNLVVQIAEELFKRAVPKNP
jgi:hypothetical protein